MKLLAVPYSIMRSWKVDDLNPGRALPHRILLELRQIAGLVVNRVRSDGVRKRSSCKQIPAIGINVEATRLLLGWKIARGSKHPARKIDLECSKSTGDPFRSVQKSAVGRKMQIGCIRLVSK